MNQKNETNEKTETIAALQSLITICENALSGLHDQVEKEDRLIVWLREFAARGIEGIPSKELLIAVNDSVKMVKRQKANMELAAIGMQKVLDDARVELSAAERAGARGD